MVKMRQEEMSIGGVIGTVAGLAGAVVAVVARFPHSVPAWWRSSRAWWLSRALSSTTWSRSQQKLMAGEKPNTDAIQKAYDKADKEAAAVVKAPRPSSTSSRSWIQLGKVTPPDNSEHLALVRQGVAQTYELLLARHRVTSAQQRLDATEARSRGAADTVARNRRPQARSHKTEERSGRRSARDRDRGVQGRCAAHAGFLRPGSVDKKSTPPDHEDKVRFRDWSPQPT